jgi:hypothetical protein
MATKNKTKAVAIRKSGTAVGLPAYLQNYKGPLGTEGIDKDDVTIPRLKMAQSMTTQVKDGDMEEGALYLNITGEALWNPGDKPLRVVPIAQAKSYILWKDRKDGGGILARAKPVRGKDGVTRYKWDKPNQSFDNKVDGKTKVVWKTKNYIDEDGLGEWGSEIPGNKESGMAATAHHDYVFALPDHDGLICAVSMSKSQVKKAKDFNATLKMGGDAPIFSRVFELSTAPETNEHGSFANYSLKPAGFVEKKEDFEKFAAYSKGFTGTGFTVDQSDGGDDDEENDRV